MAYNADNFRQVCVDLGLFCDLDTQNLTSSDVILTQYLSPIFLVFGSLGNIATAIILARLCHTLVPSCFYIIVGAVADTLVIWTHCGNAWVKSVFHVDIKLHAMFTSKTMCKIFPFTTDFFPHVSSWMIAAVAIETGLCYLRPRRLYKICSFRRARAVVLLVITLLICVNAHSFWSYGLVIDERANHEFGFCTTRVPGNTEIFWRYILPISDILIRHLIPLSLVLSFIVITVTKWKKFKEAVNCNEHLVSSKLDYNSLHQIHAAVLFLCFLYILLSSPSCVFDIFIFITNDDGLALYDRSLDVQETKLAKTILEMLRYACLSSKFIVFLIFVPMFKERFTTKICKCLKPGRNNDNSDESGSLVRRDSCTLRKTKKEGTISKENLLCSSRNATTTAV